MPNVMGVLNHMDFYKDGKQLRKTRKKYKKRFEAELGSGYRLFYMQGLKHELYLKRDVINMARFLSIKYSRSPWKQDHPYLLADRFELQPAEEDA
jgi:ribosome biogenesis protein BMS1